VIAKHVAAAHIVAREPAAVSEFWAHAECLPDQAACWRWRGYADRGGRPVLRIWRTTMHAVRVAWYAVTGEFPTGVRFTHACGDAGCVRPSHVRWSTSVAHRREIAMHSDGYAPGASAVSPAAECEAARRHSGPLRPAAPRGRRHQTPPASLVA
jgi:hypothetical protein